MPDRAPLVGTVLTLPGATLAELVAEPLDVVWIDLEHAALGPAEAQDILIGAQAAGARALVRLPVTAYELMAVMLDAGADGVVLADVSDADDVLRALARVRHPPHGARGWGPRRLSLRGRAAQAPRDAPAVWVQIESTTGVANVDAILAVDGVDAVVVGTADLSLSVGTPLDTGSPALAEAVATVRDAAARADVAYGLAGALRQAPAALLRDASILVDGTDARLCAGAVDAAAAWLRSTRDPEPTQVTP